MTHSFHLVCEDCSEPPKAGDGFQSHVLHRQGFAERPVLCFLRGIICAFLGREGERKPMITLPLSAQAAPPQGLVSCHRPQLPHGWHSMSIPLLALTILNASLLAAVCQGQNLNPDIVVNLRAALGVLEAFASTEVRAAIIHPSATGVASSMRLEPGQCLLVNTFFILDTWQQKYDGSTSSSTSQRTLVFCATATTHCFIMESEE